MKALRRSSISVLVILILLLTNACTLSQNTMATATLIPEATTPVEPPPTSTVEIVPTATEVPTLSPTETPTLEPTPAMIANGQIAYINGGNVWRHLLGTAMSIQVTTDGGVGGYPNTYTNPQFSPDGRYLAYTKNKVSSIADLVDGTVTDISSYGEFISWTGQGYEFFAQLGNMECPAVENLADQVLLNFDLYRYDFANLGSPVFLANISGGLKVVSAISKDGQWATINSCGCYSECGSEQLWHLPTVSVITPPAGFTIGNIDFSPNSNALTVSAWQVYGYSESPLYVANIDMSALTPVYSEAQNAPLLARWSPDGQWLAFTAITIDTDGMKIFESRVMLVKEDGSNLSTVEGGMAYLVDWSPDGTKLLYRQTFASPETFFSYDLGTGLKQPILIEVDPNSDTSIDWGNLQQ